jgi:hypothetical protein
VEAVQAISMFNNQPVIFFSQLCEYNGKQVVGKFNIEILGAALKDACLNKVGNFFS